MENKELTHHGIKGMRWGVRRYQNADGTLTERGKKRYSAEMEKLKKEETVLKNKQRTQAKLDRLLKKRQELDDLKKKLSGETDNEPSKVAKKTTKSETKKPKSIKDMTDEELVARINRLRLEQTLASLTPKETSKGEKFVNNVLMPVGKKAASKFGDVVLDKVKNEMSKKFGIDIGEDDVARLKKQSEKMGYKRTIEEAKTAIEKARGEYETLKRDAEMAGFKEKISTSESIRRKNEKEAKARANAEAKARADAEAKVDAEIDEIIRNMDARNASRPSSPKAKEYSSAGESFLLEAPMDRLLLPAPKDD